MKPASYWAVLAAIVLLVIVPTARGEESAKMEEEAKMPSSYDLPRADLNEYWALAAEERALRAEAELSLRNIGERRRRLLDQWQERFGEKDLSGWEVNLATGKIERREKQ